jgi:hypothetical protein
MVYGPTAASEEKRIDFSVGIARFGAILKARKKPVPERPQRLAVRPSSAQALRVQASSFYYRTPVQ